MSTLTSADIRRRVELRGLRATARAALTEFEVVGELRLAKHFENTTFRVESSDRHPMRYLRISRPGYHPHDGVVMEMKILQALNKSLGPNVVPVPTPTRAGSLATTVEGRSCVLLTAVAGKHLRPGRALGARAAASAGELLRRVHRCGAFLQMTDRPVWGPEQLLGDTPPSVSKFATPVGHDWIEAVEGRYGHLLGTGRGFRAHVTDVRELLESLPEGSPRGFVHGDPNHTNFRYSDGRAGLIDFDDCGTGHHAYDLAVALLWIMLEEGPRGGVRSSLISGYGAPLGGSSAREWSRELDIWVLARLSVLLRYVSVRDDPTIERWGAAYAPRAAKLQRELVRQLRR